jgi:sensor histidine kinase YesM
VRLQAETARLHAQLADARLGALRAQLNPHFLFNTLHAISSLVERDPRGVRRMIARLSELLRYSLEESNEQEIPLRQELAFLDRYLEIMRIRFQGTLEVTVDVDPEVQDALVPNLVLQPLVENAVKHGVSKLEGAGRITISARRSGDRTIMTVHDNGPGFGEADAPGDEGVGLRNTRERLAQLYGAAQGLSLREPPEGGLVAEIIVPFHTPGDLRTAVIAQGEKIDSQVER